MPHGAQTDAAPWRKPQVVDAPLDEGARGQRQGLLYPGVSTVVEILYQGGTYDQLNVGAVASLEIASRRLIAIVEATSKGLDSPNWKTARHYTGTSTLPVSCALMPLVPPRTKRRSTA